MVDEPLTGELGSSDANASDTPDGPLAVASRRTRRVRILHESAGAVVMIGGRCLALRRAAEWVFPKGHLEAGERPEEAAIREVREEAGLDVRILASIGVTRYEFEAPGEAAHRKKVHWFVAEPTGGDLRLEPPFEESQLLDAKTAQLVLTHEADRGLASRAFAAIGHALG